MSWLDSIRRSGKTPPIATTLKAAQRLFKSAHTPEDRLAAIAILAQEPDPLVANTLLDCLGDPDARVRLAAAQSLEPLGDPAHRDHFLGLLADQSFEVRVVAIQYLGRIRDPEAAQVLSSCLADSDSDVRLAAAVALGQIRNPVAIESLVLSLADQEPAVRHAAVAALENINLRWVRTADAARAIPRLEALRGDRQLPWVAAAAQKALEKLREAKDRDTDFWNRESGIRNL